MVAEYIPGVDPKIIRQILTEDIASRQNKLSMPGLTKRKKLRHLIYITQAELMRLELEKH